MYDGIRIYKKGKIWNVYGLTRSYFGGFLKYDIVGYITYASKIDSFCFVKSWLLLNLREDLIFAINKHIEVLRDGLRDR